ncbi:DUF3472 domain-containing protein [Flavobacterium sp. LS1R47]|uniref:DUF3472 domain-containing protein n=1 Tax=Flavobacterium frigoritolerans TaxID=2987686 RepID=A0A9X3C657_9FLAO|nr:Ig-like domain-containing protein [Flavobacterium frigoritolerans]MCV9931574.1 DUF3472 domain-containing protein [Flavobacterium frigoritolerans]
MKIKLITTQIVAFIVFTSFNLYGQGAAPSSHLNYSGGNMNSDIWMNSVNVPITSTYTYYSVMGWNTGQEGGGYCGIQDHPGGKAFIFSIWDPSNHLPIVGAYAGPGTKIENFGGEGTGLKSMNFALGWSPNTWYNLVSRVWQYNAHTFFGFWSQDTNTGIWTHLVTMDYPVADVYFRYNNDAFIEDWVGTGANVRKVLLKDAWQRADSGTWILQKSAAFDSNYGDEIRNGIYDQAFNSGTEADAFFMQTGGNTTHSFPERFINLSIESSAEAPDLTIGSVSSYDATYQPSNQTINMNWAISQTQSPQFSYTIDVFNNSSYKGDPILTTTDKIPQQRTASINASSLDNGTYYTRLIINDIYDQPSTPVYSTVTKIAGPTIALTSPINNAFFSSPASITINAIAGDISNTIDNVEFYNGTTLLGSVNTAPYSFTWSNVKFGSYAITAKVINNIGVSSTSLPVTIKVNSTCNTEGVAFGTSPAYQNGTSTYDKVFDGNTDTFFDYAIGNDGYAGLDFGVEKKIFVNTISFFPRSSHADRMIGGKFQGSNTSDFSSDVADLYTITTQPTDNTWETVNISSTKGYRYVRYLSPKGGYCNITEVKFCGDFLFPKTTPTVSMLAPLEQNIVANTGNNIPFNFTVTDPDRALSSITIKDNGQIIATITKAPYTFILNNLTTGNHNIKVITTLEDNTSSTLTNFDIIGLNCNSTLWNNSTNYLVGDQVSYQNTIYCALAPTTSKQPNLNTALWRNIGTCPTLSIEDFKLNPEFSVYPNPSDTHFNVKLTKSEGKKFYYSLIDITGKKIIEKSVGYIGDATFEQKVNVEKLPSGMYILILHLDDQIVRKKVIVNKKNYLH